MTTPIIAAIATVFLFANDAIDVIRAATPFKGPRATLTDFAKSVILPRSLSVFLAVLSSSSPNFLVDIKNFLKVAINLSVTEVSFFFVTVSSFSVELSF